MPRKARGHWMERSRASGIWRVCWTEDRVKKTKSLKTRDEVQARSAASRMDLPTAPVFLSSEDGDLSEQTIVKNSFPVSSSPAIYFLIKDDKIMYVGQSINPLNRVGTHISTRKFDRITFLMCHKDQMGALERFYIKKFMPPWNVCAIAEKSRWQASLAQGS